MGNRIKTTVITVVFNEVDRIRNTIDSVMEQDYGNIEYIIKDGGSTDGTLDLIRSAASSHDNIRFVSGPDKGIYDAMNIGLSMATGDVVQFLNAGDRFAAPDVIYRAARAMEDTGSDIVFGDVMYENSDGTVEVRRYPQYCAKKVYYLTGDCINHQCMFVKKSLFERTNFDTAFRICADREWMLRIGAYTPHLHMTALGFTVAVYPLDGASVVNKERYRTEAGMCIRKYLPLGYPIYAIFEFARSHSRLAGILHGLYRRLFMSR